MNYDNSELPFEELPLDVQIKAYKSNEIRLIDECKRLRKQLEEKDKFIKKMQEHHRQEKLYIAESFITPVTNKEKYKKAVRFIGEKSLSSQFYAWVLKDKGCTI